MAIQAQDAGDYDKALIWLPSISRPYWPEDIIDRRPGIRQRALNRVCRVHMKAKTGNKSEALDEIEKTLSRERQEFERTSKLNSETKVEPPKPDPNLMLTYGLLLADAERYVDAIEAFGYAFADPDQLEYEADKEQGQQSLDACREKIRLRVDRYRQQLKDLEGK